MAYNVKVDAEVRLLLIYQVQGAERKLDNMVVLFTVLNT
jgi:hypothetical protein